MATIRKRGKNFQISVSLGYDSNGKQIRKTTTFKPSEDISPSKAFKLATAFAADFERKCKGNIDLDENMKFYELSNWYFDYIAPNTLKISTLEHRKYNNDAYIIPRIGNLKLKDISTSRLDAMFKELSESGFSHKSFVLNCKLTMEERKILEKSGIDMPGSRWLNFGHGTSEARAKSAAKALDKPFDKLFMRSKHWGLNSNSLKSIRIQLSSLFNFAIKKGIITANPVSNVTIPKSSEVAKEFLNETDSAKLMECIRNCGNEQFETLITAILFTGMRHGEVLALTWEDIDFKNGLITIDKNVQEVGGKHLVTTPKTESSNRIIKIPKNIIDLLMRHKLEQEKIKYLFQDKYVSQNLVFANHVGNYFRENNINFKFKKFLEQNGLPKITIHGLRHSNASLLINLGIPTKIIADHLGHSNTSITENVYAHVFKSAKSKISDLLEFKLFKSESG